MAATPANTLDAKSVKERLLSFARQRKVAIRHGGRNVSAKQYAIAAIERLQHLHNPHSITKYIVQIDKQLNVLIPSSRSSHAYWIGIIQEIKNFCYASNNSHQ